MILKNVTYLNDSFQFEKGDISIKDGKFEKIATSISDGGECVDMSGKRIIPGYVNIHMHGAVGQGVDNSDYEGYNKLGRYLASTGTTSYLMAPTTWLKEDLIKFVAVIKDVIERKTEGANLLGINMEGPYLSEKYKGAHRADWLRTPEEVDFDEVNEAAGGHIMVTTLAPEIDGGIEFVKKYKDKVKISLGHTAADFDCCMEAFKSGATQITHMFNAMPSIHHRDLSLIAAAFEAGAMVELICDGAHVDKATVKMAYKMFGDDKIIVINDTEKFAGLPDGEYFNGYSKLIVADGVAKLENGTIAGGSAPIHTCVKNLIRWGISAESAVKMASYNPTVALEIKGKGIIKEGYDADFNVVAENFDITNVYIGGKLFE